MAASAAISSLYNAPMLPRHQGSQKSIQVILLDQRRTQHIQDVMFASAPKVNTLNPFLGNHAYPA
jgi:hypothetical protein